MPSPYGFPNPSCDVARALEVGSEAVKVEVLLVVENSTGSYSMQLDWLCIFACTTVDYTKKIL